MLMTANNHKICSDFYGRRINNCNYFVRGLVSSNKVAHLYLNFVAEFTNFVYNYRTGVGILLNINQNNHIM